MPGHLENRILINNQRIQNNSIDRKQMNSKTLLHLQGHAIEMMTGTYARPFGESQLNKHQNKQNEDIDKMLEEQQEFIPQFQIEIEPEQEQAAPQLNLQIRQLELQNQAIQLQLQYQIAQNEAMKLQIKLSQSQSQKKSSKKKKEKVVKKSVKKESKQKSMFKYNCIVLIT